MDNSDAAEVKASPTCCPDGMPPVHRVPKPALVNRYEQEVTLPLRVHRALPSAFAGAAQLAAFGCAAYSAALMQNAKTAARECTYA